MDLNDFGTTQPPDNRNNGDQRNYYRPPGYYAGDVGNSPVQWKVVQSGVFEICGVTAHKLEPARPVICLFEDIDAIIEVHGDSEFFLKLAASPEINTVINIATTNYPERLDRRIVSRPRRFDRIIKIEVPTAPIRETYFK